MQVTYESELYHYGVKGMKWGVRRYQNPDGTLTKAGNKRYRKDKKLYDEYQNNKAMSDFYKAKIKTGNSFSKASIMATAAKYERKANKSLSKISKFGMEQMKKEEKTKLNKGKDSVNKFVDACHELDKMGIPLKYQTVEMLHDRRLANQYVERKKMFDKHPDLYDDFGDPGEIDDDDLYDLVLQEKGYE